ncbi:MAG: asparagine synthase-related protein, partial [Pseudomonadota bacterium]
MYIKYCRTSFALEQFDGIESACHKTLILYFEGAIYNRPFLQSLLPSQDTALSEEDDNAALLLVLFQSFGEALIPKLLGDFILAIYDSERQTWFCARDHMGVRPFFYFEDESYFVFGSDIAAIAADEHVPDELCTESIAVFLREGELYDSQLTFHKHIKRLKPANTLTLDQGGIRFQCYWRPEELDRRTFESAEHCASELLKLLQDAVNIRIDPNKNTGVHLSGGLDSSAITALAAPILRTYGKSTHSFSWLPPPNGGQRGDPEWAPGELLASEFGLNHHYTPFGARDISEILYRFNLLDFDNVDLWYEHKVRELADQNGVNVILSGWGGDEFVSYHGAYRCFETFWGG